jgi:hypothetical protein
VGIEGDVKAKSIENILNQIIAKNFPRKEMVIQVEEAFTAPTKQEPLHVIL